ncbi:ABC transporter permease [Leifsonia aquatica]|uniref:ABC transporter permease n=1 Tax=Leifsonia aquatica TaxID=144185 RepID=UPI00384BED8F
MSSKLRSVTRFEFSRTIRRPQFWAAALALPLFFAVLMAVVAWAGTARPPAGAAVEFEYTDASGLISESIAKQHGGTPATPGAEQRARDGDLTAYVAFPADPTTEPARIIGADRGLFSSSDYTTVARTVFNDSITAALDPDLAALSRTTLATTVETYIDGSPAEGLSGMIVPGLLAMLLIMVIALLGNQMLSSTVEEKENRISEMMLVSVPAGTLIRGKIIALTMLGLVQIAIVAAAAAAIYAVSAPSLPLGDLGLDALTVDPIRLSVGIAILAGGLLMFMAMLVLLGALMPSVKDAAPFFSVIIVVAVSPLYLITAVLTNPYSPVVQTLTYFPFSAPMTALLRNAVGTLDPMLGLLVAAELLILGAIILRFAIVAFQRGVIQYGRRLRVRDLVG